MLRNYLLLFLLVGIVCPGSSQAQTEHPWQIRTEIGRYEIHDWKASGFVTTVQISRQIRTTMLAFNLGFTFGFGDDNFASLEPGFELRLPLHERFRLIGDVGAGLMPESTFSTISLTYFASGGVEVSLSQHTSILLALRRGSHSNFGDSGTFSGPHLLMVGWAYAF